MADGASLEIGRSVKMYSPHQQSRGPEWMQAKKIIVISISYKMRIKIPGPGHSCINPPAFEGGTMKEITLRRVVCHGQQDGAPPIGHGYIDIIIINILIPMCREDVVLAVGVELHEKSNLSHVIETGDLLGLAPGP